MAEILIRSARVLPMMMIRSPFFNSSLGESSPKVRPRGHREHLAGREGADRDSSPSSSSSPQHEKGWDLDEADPFNLSTPFETSRVGSGRPGHRAEVGWKAAEVVFPSYSVRFRLQPAPSPSQGHSKDRRLE